MALASLLAWNALTAKSSITAQERTSAVGDIMTLPSQLKHSFINHGEFQPKRAPEEGEWLDAHEETGQTFAQYIRYRANLPNKYQNTIYILPLGSFEGNTHPDLSIIAEGLRAYYYPMKVKLLPAVPSADIPVTRRQHQGNTQLHCGETLDWMVPRLPKNAYAMLAVTMIDLYPKEGWNYVFGLASFKRRVGAFSFARYQPKAINEQSQKLMLERSLKLVTHETGHMFAIKHCTHYECNMGGVNHIAEADKAPLHLCPVCLRKLYHAIHFKPTTRYIKLLTFYRKHGLEDQVKWLEQRLNHIHNPDQPVNTDHR